MNPNEIADKIMQLTLDEIRELNEILADRGYPGWGSRGVREPRVPLPESPGDAIALETEDE